jgi:hypothetical protein
MKTALVIGNGEYENIAKLKKPINDSRDMKEALESLDFTVFYGEDLEQKEFKRLVREFGQNSVGVEISLFFYAGHGMQYLGRNFLVPVDAEILSEDEIPDSAISLDFIQNRMEDSKAKLNLFFLDSSRDNPFEKNIKSRGGRSANIHRGLANPNMSFTHQSIISFATGPDQIALDNPKERNGVFTKNLLKHISSKGAKIDDVLKKTVKGVIEETNNFQVPWVHQKLYDDFYLNGKGETVSEQSEEPKRDSSVATLSQSRNESEVNRSPKKQILFNLIASLLLVLGYFGYWEIYRYEIYRDFFVDKKTDLMWQKKNREYYTWQEAMRYCENLNLSGYSNWRLPSRDEAKSLMTYFHEWETYEKWSQWFDASKHKRHNDKFVESEISHFVPTWTWTSKKYYKDISSSWIVSFEYGDGGWDNQTNSTFAVCVQDL